MMSIAPRATTICASAEGPDRIAFCVPLQGLCRSPALSLAEVVEGESRDQNETRCIEATGNLIECPSNDFTIEATNHSSTDNLENDIAGNFPI